MPFLNNYIICLFIGVGLVIVIDSICSIASRKLNFNYGYFGVLSFFAYTFTAYLVAEKTGYWTATLISVMLVGLFDATIGWKISQKLKANYGKYKEQTLKLTLAHRLLYTIFFSTICAGVGIYLANR